MIDRMIRRIFAIVLCVALVLGMAGECLAYSGVSTWAKKEVDRAAALGIIPSALEQSQLSAPMSRLDMCHMAVNTFEKITNTKLYPANINHFSDTRDADVCVAFELGLVSGYPDGTFQPSRRISRQEFAKIINNLVTCLGWSEDANVVGAFQDDNKISSWALRATARVISLGIVNGSGGKLDPKGTTSIEQSCAMLMRAFQLLESDIGVFSPAEPVGDAYTPTYSGVSKWAKEMVKQMDLLGMLPNSVSKSVMTQPITRGQMCEMALLTYTAITGNVPEVSKNAFSDTTLPEITQANALGIVNGMPDGTFHPDDLLTREQFFQITDNLLKACGNAKPSDAALLKQAYTDAADIPKWARPSIALLYRMDVMRGDNKSRALPLANTTSEQAIVMLMRAYDQVVDWCNAHPLREIQGPLTTPSEATRVVEMAKSLVGYPYVWAGASPSVGFDCSGLVYYIYKQLGYNLYRAGDGMAKEGTAVLESEMQPGDIIIFSNRSTGAIQHVGLYIGDGLMVHAQSSRTGVVISRYDYDTSKYIYTIRRILS